jgi:iron complex transport system substrate-binding protein
LGTGALAEGAALPEGEYAPDGFTFSGGTGKVTISCPSIAVAGGEVTATLVFSSPNYPKLTVDGVEYVATHEGKTSIFTVPAVVNADMTVVGTTTAMSKPHDIEYTVHIWMGETPPDAPPEDDGAEAGVQGASVALADRDRALPGLTWQSEMPLKYAHEFAVDYYEGGYKLLTIGDGKRYLVVPEGGDVPGGLDGDVKIIRQPLKNVYLAATAAMALFDAVDGLDAITLSGTQADGWYIENAAAAMARGDMLYAGKYSAPDYELLMGMGCPLAIESTMILHTPKVQEMLEQLGVTVFIEHSSYESHPLGRTEWVKLYAAMLNKEEQAAAFFDEQAKVIDELKDFPNTEQKVAFFYVSTDGSVVVRGAGDYVAGMIELAGGRYIFSDTARLDSARAAVAISMEDFYAAAVDADYLIYNASIDAPLNSLEDLLAKSALFADFKAVQAGNVWSTDKYLYQATDIVGELITDINHMLTGQTEGMTFIHRL